MSNDMAGLIGGASTSGESGTQYFSSFGRVRREYKFQKNDAGKFSEMSREEYIAGPKSRKEAESRGLTWYGQIKAIIHLDEAADIAIESGQPADKAFGYKREIVVGSPDWNNNVIPALEELRGKPYSKGKDKRAQEIQADWDALEGVYVESLDVPQLRWDNVEKKIVKAEKEAGSGTYWSSFYPVRTFKNRAECVAARKVRYSKGAANGGAPVAAPAPKRDYERPESETEKGWPRTMATIQKRLARGDDPQAIADDLEIELRYVEQFVAVPF